MRTSPTPGCLTPRRPARTGSYDRCAPAPATAPSGPVSDQAAAGGAGIGAGRIGVLSHSLGRARRPLRRYHPPPGRTGSRRSAAADPDGGVAGRRQLPGGRGRAGVDAYLTADLRHHPASEHLPTAALPCWMAHWATERPWLDELADFC